MKLRKKKYYFFFIPLFKDSGSLIELGTLSRNSRSCELGNQRHCHHQRRRFSLFYFVYFRILYLSTWFGVNVLTMTQATHLNEPTFHIITVVFSTFPPLHCRFSSNQKKERDPANLAFHRPNTNVSLYVCVVVGGRGVIATAYIQMSFIDYVDDDDDAGM